MKNSVASPAGSDGTMSAKAPGRKGQGLASVQAIVEKYQGKSEFCYGDEEGIFGSTVLLFQ